MSQDKEDGHSSAVKKSKVLYVGLAAGIIVIIALLGIVIYLLTRKGEAEPQAIVPDNRATIITKDNVEEVMSRAEEPVVAGVYHCSMNNEWHFKDSSLPSYDAYVANPGNNSYTVYFDLFLEDTLELVYSSPYMEVGAELDELMLSKQLDAGEYPAVVTYHLVDEQHETLSTVSVTVTLYVEQ